MRIAIAVIAGAVIFGFGFFSLRGLIGGHSSGAALEPLPPGVLVTYWCEECGAELVVRSIGSGAPPKHCGEPMKRREEILRDN